MTFNLTPEDQLLSYTRLLGGPEARLALVWINLTLHRPFPGAIHR